MAYYAAPNATNNPHNRGFEFGREGTGLHNAYYNRDSSHHDYTNLPAARRSSERHKDETSPFPSSNNETNQSAHPVPSTRNDDVVTSSPVVGTDAPSFRARERMGNGGGHGDPSNSSFRRRREKLAHQGLLHEDKEFPPLVTSIYYSRQPTHETAVRWMRPKNICAPEKPVFVQRDFSRFDVQQGRLGDCWLVAAMACLCGADHAHLLQRVIPDPDQQTFTHPHYAGLFCFCFWHFGQWRQVLIDDFLPTVGGALKFVHSSDRTEFWPALMEKAYAKLYGSYEALKGGWMTESLTDLTGGVAESFRLRGKQANYPRNIIAILFKAFDRGALVGAAIDGKDGAEVSEAMLPNGLVAGHAYSVTSLRQVPLQGGDVVLIRIRNPYGNKVEWKGAWSDSSPEWQQVHPHNRERLGLIRRNDGEFWMSFEDFMNNFDVLTICNLTPDTPMAVSRRWFTSEHHGRWVKHFNAGGRPALRDSHWANPQYVLKLRDTDEDDDSVCSVIVQLMQKDRRRLKQKGEVYAYIGFIIYRVLPLFFAYMVLNDIRCTL